MYYVSFWTPLCFIGVSLPIQIRKKQSLIYILQKHLFNVLRPMTYLEHFICTFFPTPCSALNLLSKAKKEKKGSKTETKNKTEPTEKDMLKRLNGKKRQDHQCLGIAAGIWRTRIKHLVRLQSVLVRIGRWKRGRLDSLPLVNSYYHLGKKQSALVSLIVNA